MFCATMPTAGGKRQVILSKGDKSDCPAFWSSEETGHVLVFWCDRESNRNGISLFFLVRLYKEAKKRKFTRPSFVSLVSIKVALQNLSSDLEGPDFGEVWNTVVRLSLCQLLIMNRLGRVHKLVLFFILQCQLQVGNCREFLLTYLLTYSMEQSPSWEANRFPASQEIPRIVWNPKFIIVFTSARHLSLSWATSIQSNPPTHYLKIYLNITLPSTPGFPSGFPTKTLYKPHPSPIRATFPAHLILLDFITRKVLGEEYRSLSSSFLFNQTEQNGQRLHAKIFTFLQNTIT